VIASELIAAHLKLPVMAIIPQCAMHRKKKQSTEKLKLAIGVLKCLIHIKSWSHKNSSVALLPAEN